MAIVSSHQRGISHQELREAIPENLHSKNLHLHWVDKSPSGGGFYILTAKIEINGQMLLLRTRTNETSVIDTWEVNDPTYHTNARLVALDRIMTDPENEDILLSI